MDLNESSLEALRTFFEKKQLIRALQRSSQLGYNSDGKYGLVQNLVVRQVVGIYEIISGNHSLKLLR